MLITLKSIQWIDAESSETELITPGLYEKTPGGDYIITYDESMATGFDGSKTVLSCYGDRLCTLNRSGNSSSDLIIEKEKKHYCHYGTPFGSFMMGIFTHKIDNRLNDNGGDIYMKYTIDINSSYVSDKEIFMNIK